MSETFEAPQSRIEAILQNILGADNTILPPFSRNEVLLIQIAGLIADKQDALISGENIKTINGGSILEAGNLNLEKGWRKIGGVYTLQSDKTKVVFSPTVGSDANTEYIETPAFQCEKMRIYIVSPKQSEVNNSISGYVKIADNVGGTNFGAADDYKFLAGTVLAKDFDVYSFVDIITSPYMPTYTQLFVNGKLASSAVSTTQVCWSGVAQNLTQITGLEFSIGTHFYSGMKFVLLGVDK